MVKVKDFIEILNRGIIVYIKQKNNNGEDVVIYMGYNKIGYDEELTEEILRMNIKSAEVKSVLTIIKEPNSFVDIYVEN